MLKQHNILFNDGYSIPQLGLGVWQISQQKIGVAIETALACGYRHIDTASIYDNEEGVGQAIKLSRLQRNELFITTKLWNDAHGTLQPRKALETSLQKLKIDYVDLYLIHWPLARLDKYLSIWNTFIQLQQEGLIRSIGVSNFNISQLQKLITESGQRPVLNQIELHPFLQQKTLRTWQTHHNIATASWSPLAQGMRTLLEQPLLTELANKYHKTTAQIILRWHIECGLVVIPKSDNLQRIQENYDIFNFSLSQQELLQLATLDKGKRIGPDPEYFYMDAEYLL